MEDNNSNKIKREIRSRFEIINYKGAYYNYSTDKIAKLLNRRKITDYLIDNMSYQIGNYFRPNFDLVFRVDQKMVNAYYRKQYTNDRGFIDSKLVLCKKLCFRYIPKITFIIITESINRDNKTKTITQLADYTDIKIAIFEAKKYTHKNKLNCYITNDRPTNSIQDQFYLEFNYNIETKLVEVKNRQQFKLIDKLSETDDKRIYSTIKEWLEKHDLYSGYKDQIYTNNYDNNEDPTYIRLDLASGDSDYSGNDITYSNYLSIRSLPVTYTCRSYDIEITLKDLCNNTLEEYDQKDIDWQSILESLGHYVYLDDDLASDLTLEWENQAFDNSYEYDIKKIINNIIEYYQDTNEDDLELPHNLDKESVLEFLGNYNTNSLASDLFFEILSNEQYVAGTSYSAGIANLDIDFTNNYNLESAIEELIDLAIKQHGHELWQECHKDQLLLPFNSDINCSINTPINSIGITMALCNKLGFCKAESYKFCELNNLNPNSSYTLPELEQACLNTPQYKVYINKLEAFLTRKQSKNRLAA